MTVVLEAAREAHAAGLCVLPDAKIRALVLEMLAQRTAGGVR